MATVEKDAGQEIMSSNTASDVQLSSVLEAATMTAATESVISESANVVVQRLSSGSPTWTLTATVGDSEVEVTGEGEKDDDCMLFNIQGSGLLTQAQLRQIGEALKAEVHPMMEDDVPIGMLEEPQEILESVMMETGSGPDMEAVVSGDNPMFSGSDQQVVQHYDELSLHAAEGAVEALEGERQLILGLTDSGESLASRQLTIILDDSGESLGTRQLFEDVMNTDILRETVKAECLDADIAATATVTTSEEGQLPKTHRGRKSKFSVTPKRQGTRRSARLAKPASPENTSSNTTDKQTDDTKQEPDLRLATEDVGETTEDAEETTDSASLTSESDQQRAAEPTNNKSSNQQRAAQPFKSKSSQQQRTAQLSGSKLSQQQRTAEPHSSKFIQQKRTAEPASSKSSRQKRTAELPSSKSNQQQRTAQPPSSKSIQQKRTSEPYSSKSSQQRTAELLSSKSSHQKRTAERSSSKSSQQKRRAELQISKLSQQKRTAEPQSSKLNQQKRTSEPQNSKLSQQKRTAEPQSSKLSQQKKISELVSSKSIQQKRTVEPHSNKFSLQQRMAEPASSKSDQQKRTTDAPSSQFSQNQTAIPQSSKFSQQKKTAELPSSKSSLQLEQSNAKSNQQKRAVQSSSFKSSEQQRSVQPPSTKFNQQQMAADASICKSSRNDEKTDNKENKHTSLTEPKIAIKKEKYPEADGKVETISYSSKLMQEKKIARRHSHGSDVSKTDKTTSIKREKCPGTMTDGKVEKINYSNEVIQAKKVVRRHSVGSNVSKTEYVERVNLKPKHERKFLKHVFYKKESLEEGELDDVGDDGDELEEGEVRDSPKKRKEISQTENSGDEKERSEKERSAHRRRDSKERRQRRSSSEKRERREARSKRREQRRQRVSVDTESDDKPLSQILKELSDVKEEEMIKPPANKNPDGRPRKYSLDDVKRLKSPPLARRSKPFSAADIQRKKVTPQPSLVKKPADTDEESDISLSSSDGGDPNPYDSDWTTDDDPDKLWCICRRPFDNRFMIRCDDCAEWYHGSCVNICKQEGQRLDKEHIQWICPHCVKKEKRNIQGGMPKEHRDRHHSGKREDQSHDGGKRRSSGKKKRLKYSKPDPPKQHCLGVKCENWAKPAAIYCSTRCIVSHCRDALKLIEQEREKTMGSGAAGGSATSGSKHKRDNFGDALTPQQESSSKPADREPERISVIERHTGRLRTGMAAPTRLQLPIWLERHPTYEVLKPNMKHGYTTGQFYSSKSKHSSSRDHHDKDRKEKDDKPLGEVRDTSKTHTPARVRRESESRSTEGSSRRESATSKEHKDSHGEASHSSTHSGTHREGSSKKDKSDNTDTSAKKTKTPPTKAASEVQESVRMSVKRALWDALWTRVKAAGNFHIPEHKVKKIAYHIENELFKLYNETNVKYKAKYRSLIFNIKDPKNQGLFRRILKGRIPGDELVCMSSDKLASKELSEWRERESKHVLDMIVTEEKNRKVVPLTKKTHKGEVEISEDLSMLESNMASPTKGPTSGLETLSPPPLASPVNPLSMLQDTTSLHSHHLFDMNCKICTGIVAPPREENVPAVKRSRTMSGSDRQSSTEDDSLMRQVHTPEEEEETKENKVIEEKDELEEGEEREEVKEEMKEEINEEKDEERDERIEEEGREEGELDEEDDVDDDDDYDKDDIEKPSYSYSEEAEAVQSPPEYEPPDVGSPDGHTASSFINAPDNPVLKPAMESPRQRPAEAPREVPVSPAMSPDEEQQPKRITPPVVWKGAINMPEVARFVAAGYHVSGPPQTVTTDIPQQLELCGRIPYTVVWDYFNKLRSSRTTELVIVRFHITQDQDKASYATLFQYFHSRKRIGVVSNNRPHVKDMYLLPLSAHEPVPVQIQPFNGPGLERHRPHTFLGLIVRHKEQRLRSISMGHAPVSERSALPGLPPPSHAHPTHLKRHLSDPMGSGTPPPDWTEQGDFAAAKRAKPEQNIPETQITDPIVAQYANADPTELAEEPYSPTREEREAPYDPADLMDDIGEKRRDESQRTTKMEVEGSMLMDNPAADPNKLNDLLENMSELNATDIASAASDVTENLLTAFSSKPNLTEQQQLLIKLTKQVEDAKKALLDRQIASLQSEIDKAATEMHIASVPGGPIDDNTTPGVTATLMHQLPGTKLPSPRILRAPADSSTNAADQTAVNVSGSPGTPTEEDAQGRSGLGMIQSAYMESSLQNKNATYTYGNVLTEDGASYPEHAQLYDNGAGLPPQLAGAKRPSQDNNNQSQINPPITAPNWTNPCDGPKQAPWNNEPFKPSANPGIMSKTNLEFQPQQYNPEAPYQSPTNEKHNRDLKKQTGEHRTDHNLPHHQGGDHRSDHSHKRAWDGSKEHRGHHRSGPPSHESGPEGPRGHESEQDSRRGHGANWPGHRAGWHGEGGQPPRGHGHREGGGGERGWGSNKWRGKRQGQGYRGRDHDTKHNYHRY